MEKHFVGKLAQKAIIEKDGKVLLARGIGDKIWELPGGRLHVGETPQEGLAREVLEEFNLVIAVGKPVYLCGSFHYKDNSNQTFVAYACTVLSGEFRADSAEVEEWRWANKDEALALPFFDECKGALEAYFGVK